MADNGAAGGAGRGVGRGAGRGAGSDSDGLLSLLGAVHAVEAAGRGAGRGAVPAVGAAVGAAGRGVVGEKRSRDCNCMAGCPKCMTAAELLARDRAAIVQKSFKACTQCKQGPKPLPVEDTIKFLQERLQWNSTVSRKEQVRQAVEGTLKDANDNRQKQPVIIAECGCDGGACYTACLSTGNPRVVPGKAYGKKDDQARHILDAIKKFIKSRDQLLAERAARDAPSPAAAAHLAGAAGAAVAAGALGGGVPGQLPAGQQPQPPSGPARRDAYTEIRRCSMQIRIKAYKWPICAVMLFFLYEQENKEWSAYHKAQGTEEEFEVIATIIDTLKMTDPEATYGSTCLHLTKDLLEKTLDAVPSYIANYKNGRRNMQGLFRYFIDKYLAATETEEKYWNIALQRGDDGSADDVNLFLKKIQILFTSYEELHKQRSSRAQSGAGGAAQVRAGGAAQVP